jgi:Ulp1 family protease
MTLLDYLRRLQSHTAPLTQRLRIMFESKDLHIMRTSSTRLNDTCVNGIATLFHAEFSQASSPSASHSQRCAVFSTHDLPMIRYNAKDDELWRRLHRLEYWNKDFWILPIHRTHPSLHWVLCCISLRTRELFLFDSLSDRLGWRRDTKVISTYINKRPLFM